MDDTWDYMQAIWHEYKEIISFNLIDVLNASKIIKKLNFGGTKSEIS